uniref:Transportin-1 n=1 Tax=Parastrongyloides trichosuri TaxID=131310 RepID=A0A0N4ZB02_PARTI
MTWAPEQNELEQVLTLLNQTHSGNTEVQRDVHAQLEKLSKHPQFSLYLAFILSNMKTLNEASRSVSGLILKNIIKNSWQQLPDDIKGYIKEKCCETISDSSSLIRATVGIIITTIYTNEQGEWIDVLHYLIKLLDSNDFNVLDGALGALHKICEDSALNMEDAHVESLVNPVLKFFKHENPKLRSVSLNIINNLLLFNNGVFSNHFNQFIEAVFQLANDQDPEVLKQLCRCLTLTSETFFDKILPQMNNIMNFMIHKTRDPNEEIALEACEFWLTLTDHAEQDQNILTPILPQLLPVLLGCMRYTQKDIILLKGDMEDDSKIPDKEEDIKPRFHRAKVHGFQNQENGSLSLSEIEICSGISSVNNQSTDDDGGSDEEDEDDTDWNLRKCAAATLDVITGIFGDDCLPIILPLLKDLLFHKNWEYRESGILCLGAIAEGCISGIIPYLNELFPYLIESLDSEKALIRSITCWSLSRYCHYICQDTSSQAFLLLLKGLLSRMLDSNKSVQRAACSAFAILEEESGKNLVPYLKEIIETLSKCFELYQTRNLLILYDAVGTLADTIDDELKNDNFINTIMPILMSKWSTVEDCNRELFPLLECMFSVANALHDKFIPYSEPIFDRCIKLIHLSLTNIQASGNVDSSNNYFDREFIIVSLDLLSELTEALGVHVTPLLKKYDVVGILSCCSVDSNEEVKQSAFAFLGDVAKNCPQLIEIHCHQFARLLISCFTEKNTSLMNNAIWAFGVLTSILKDQVDVYVQIVVPILIAILNHEKAQKTVLENTAIALGRLGIYSAPRIAPHLPTFIRPWCLSLRSVRDNEEKHAAFTGLICMIHYNPSGVLADFVFFCDAVSSFNNPPEEIRAQISSILKGFRIQVGDVFWNQFFNHCPPGLQQKLNIFYGV